MRILVVGGGGREHALSWALGRHGHEVIAASDALHVPHLLMHERGFVLRPLADLAPDFEHPILYQTIRELVAALEDEHEVRPSDLPRRWFER